MCFMTEEKREIWRWNVDDVWQSFSSMFQEAWHASRAHNEIQRYHHLTGALLFGACTVEAFMNAQMRIHCAKSAMPDAEIVQVLRKGNLLEKLRKWPSVISGVSVEKLHLATIAEFLELRNEVTHRKRRDHSLYAELDALHIDRFVEAI